jgi:hypothetical protein
MLAEDGWGLYSSAGEPLMGVEEPSGLSGRILTEQVASSTLDRYVLENKVEKIDLLKVDVEGAELSVLRGGERLLREKAPVLIIEFNRNTTRVFGYGLSALKEYIESFGYTLYRVSEGGRNLKKLGNVLDISRYENLVAIKGIC